MQQRKNMIPRKESFVCLECKTENDSKSGFERNHCKECLCSRHVDGPTPGDRNELCKGIMRATYVTGAAGGVYTITHRCERCRFTRNNKAAPDDNRTILINLMNNAHPQPRRNLR